MSSEITIDRINDTIKIINTSGQSSPSDSKSAASKYILSIVEEMLGKTGTYGFNSYLDKSETDLFHHQRLAEYCPNVNKELTSLMSGYFSNDNEENDKDISFRILDFVTKISKNDFSSDQQKIINAFYLDYLEDNQAKNKDDLASISQAKNLDDLASIYLPKFKYNPSDSKQKNVYKYSTEREKSATIQNDLEDTYFKIDSYKLSFGSNFFLSYCSENTSFENPGLRELLFLKYPGEKMLFINGNETKEVSSSSKGDKISFEKSISEAYNKIMDTGGNNSGEVKRSIIDSIITDETHYDGYYLQGDNDKKPWPVSDVSLLFKRDISYGKNNESKEFYFDLGPFLTFTIPYGNVTSWDNWVSIILETEASRSDNFMSLSASAQEEYVEKNLNMISFLGLIQIFKDIDKSSGSMSNLPGSYLAFFINLESFSGIISNLEEIFNRQQANPNITKRVNAFKHIARNSNSIKEVANYIVGKTGIFDSQVFAMAKFLVAIMNNIKPSEIPDLLIAVGDREVYQNKAAMLHYEIQNELPRTIEINSIGQRDAESIEESRIRRVIREFFKRKASNNILLEAATNEKSPKDFIDSDYKVKKADLKTFWDDAKGAQQGDEFAREINKELNLTGQNKLEKDSEYNNISINIEKIASKNKEKDARASDRQSFADSIQSGKRDPQWNQWFPDNNSVAKSDENVKDFYAWVSTSGSEPQKKIAKLITNGRNDLAEADVKILKILWEKSEYKITKSNGDEEVVKFEPAAKEYLKTREAQANFGITYTPPQDTSGGEFTTTGGSVETVEYERRSTAGYKDANEKQAEIEYGKIGTFLRASIRINSNVYRDINRDDLRDDLRESDESKVRAAIRKLLLKEAPAGIEIENPFDDPDLKEKALKSEFGKREIMEFAAAFVNSAIAAEKEEKGDGFDPGSIDKDQEAKDFAVILEKALRDVDGPDDLQTEVSNMKSDLLSKYLKKEVQLSTIKYFNTSPILKKYITVESGSESTFPGVVVSRLQKSIVDGYEATENMNNQKTKYSILSAMSETFEDSVWAVFCTFNKPNDPYYSVCIESPNAPEIVGMSFPQSANAGNTPVTNLGKYASMAKLGGKNVSVTALSLYVQELVLEGIKNAAQGDKKSSAETTLSVAGLKTDWNKTPQNIEGTMTYNELGKLFIEGDINTDRFKKAIKIMEENAEGNRVALGAIDQVLNTKGILRSEKNNLIDNAKKRNRSAYESAVFELNKIFVNEFNPGSIIPLMVNNRIFGSGRKGLKITSPNKKAAKILETDASDKNSEIQTAFAELFTNVDFAEEAQARRQTESGISKDREGLFKRTKKITLPLPIPDFYDVHTEPERIKNLEFTGVKAGKVKGKGEDAYNGLLLPPFLSEQQFYVVAGYYATRKFMKLNNKKIYDVSELSRKDKKDIRDIVKNIMPNPGQKYNKYRSNYKEMIQNRKEELQAANRKEEMLAMMKEAKEIMSGVSEGSSKTFEYFNVQSVEQPLIDITGKLKKRDTEVASDSGATVERKNNFTFQLSPGLSKINIYDKFIKVFIAACSSMSAAANTSKEKAAIVYESMINRHELLYEIYLKNKIKENVKKRFLSSFDNRSKKKLKAALFEDYKVGDLAIDNYKDVFGRSPKKKTREIPDVKGSGSDKKGPEKPGNYTDKPGSDLGQNQDGRGVRGGGGHNSGPTSTNVVSSMPSPFRRIVGEDDANAHEGIDFSVANSDGFVTPIDNGKIVEAKWENSSDKNQGWGWYVKIKHSDGTHSLYAHMEDPSDDSDGDRGYKIPKVDDEVYTNTIIGKAGKTGNATNVHLHLEIEKAGEAKWLTAFKYLKDKSGIFDLKTKDDGQYKREFDAISAAIEGHQDSTKQATNNNPGFPVTGDNSNNLQLANYNPETGLYQDIDPRIAPGDTQGGDDQGKNGQENNEGDNAPNQVTNVNAGKNFKGTLGTLVFFKLKNELKNYNHGHVFDSVEIDDDGGNYFAIRNNPDYGVFDTTSVNGVTYNTDYEISVIDATLNEYSDDTITYFINDSTKDNNGRYVDFFVYKENFNKCMVDYIKLGENSYIRFILT